jgi:hypothetical protein
MENKIYTDFLLKSFNIALKTEKNIKNLLKT